MSDVQKRSDAWRYVCPRCGLHGDWKDRQWIAASALSAHLVDAHGGAFRGVGEWS